MWRSMGCTKWKEDHIYRHTLWSCLVGRASQMDSEGHRTQPTRFHCWSCHICFCGTRWFQTSSLWHNWTYRYYHFTSFPSYSKPTFHRLFLQPTSQLASSHHCRTYLPTNNKLSDQLYKTDFRYCENVHRQTKVQQRQSFFWLQARHLS